MQEDLQALFNRIKDKQREQKDLRHSYKESLEQTPGYREAVDAVNHAKARKQQIETTVKESFTNEFDKLDELKVDLESDFQMLSDLALTKLMKGETIEVKDEHDADYEPVFGVKFRKMK